MMLKVAEKDLPRRTLIAKASQIKKPSSSGTSNSGAALVNRQTPDATPTFVGIVNSRWEYRDECFGKIMGAIFGTKADAVTPGGTAAAGGASTSGASTATIAPSIDVAPILDQAVAAKKEKLEWRTSIVDLMKALDLDSSLSERKALAKELNYPGDTNDSAA